MSAPARQKILFVSTRNAARSPMAEGYINARYGDRFEALSAGMDPGTLNPFAVRAMTEIGIDISGHQPKGLTAFMGMEVEVMVTVCEGGRCPFFPWAKREIHREFTDPAGLSGTDEEIMDGMRRIRDELIAWIDETFGAV